MVHQVQLAETVQKERSVRFEINFVKKNKEKKIPPSTPKKQ
jgi:hypothetical protein